MRIVVCLSLFNMAFQRPRLHPQDRIESLSEEVQTLRREVAELKDKLDRERASRIYYEGLAVERGSVLSLQRGRPPRYPFLG